MKKDNLLRKWLLDEITEAELEEFKKTEDYELDVKMIDKVKYFDVPENATVKSYDDFKADTKGINVPVIQLNTYKMLFRIASLFIIGASVYFLFFFNNLTNVQTLASQRITFELPDASSVVLNADSKAKYNKEKWVNKREISLNGEAFFKVAKGSKFDVLTSNGIVSVVGTQFNVKNRDNYFEVKCFEGIVRVNSNGKLHQLTRGYTYSVLNGNITLDSINNKQPKWIDNISSFKGVPLYEVLEEFERQYNITIETKKVDTKRLFTGSFVNNNLDQALSSITIPFNLTFKKDNSNKITLYKNQ